MCLIATSNRSRQTIIATAIPKITEDFPGVNLIGWYSSAFFISLACTQPFWYGPLLLLTLQKVIDTNAVWMLC
jgi:hypothetical protein